LDVHREQITFDYVDTVTGEVACGQIGSADRRRLAVWLRRFAGRGDIAFGVEGCTGWRCVVEELTRAGVEAHLASRPTPRPQGGRRKHAKTDRADSRLMHDLLLQDREPR
jgi:transposase